MNTNVKKILEELYALDPKLKDHEERLLKILQEMTENRPDAEFDEAFRKRLKREVLIQIEREKSHSQAFSWKNALMGFLLGGASIAFAAFAVFHFATPSLLSGSQDSAKETPTQQVASNPPKVDFAFKTDNRDKNAFGPLAFVSQASSGGDHAMAAGKPATPTSPMAAPVPTLAPAADSKMRAEDSRIMPVVPIGQPVYRYVYSGSGLTIADTEMGVFQKKDAAMTPADAESLLSNFKISSLDLRSFSDLVMNNLGVSEDKPYGLSVNVDFVEGGISIGRNWQKWPQNTCKDDACFRANQTKIEDIPSDEKALDIASKFVQDYGIDVSSYGKPFVNNDWKVQYDRATDKSTAYVPDTVSVVYPLVVDGKSVYEEYGQPKGIAIGIDVKSGHVSDVNGIERLSFSESSYPIENDFSKILQMAEKGGRNATPYPGMPESNSGAIEVQLGEPQISYVHISQYQDGKSDQYLVPSVVFPVTQAPREGEYFPDKIIVPLVKDFFNTPVPPIMYKGGVAE